MRKARTIRSRTQLAHLEPPYARDTDFWVLDVVAYCLGRRAGIYTGMSRQQTVPMTSFAVTQPVVRVLGIQIE